jgi:hypothetical protein
MIKPRPQLYNAIMAINPSAVINIQGGVIEWQDTPVISDADIQAKLSELQAEYDANQYQRDRAEEYPDIGDQLDMQYHDKKDGTTTWEDAVQAVKDAHPKS